MTSLFWDTRLQSNLKFRLIGFLAAPAAAAHHLPRGGDGGGDKHDGEGEREMREEREREGREWSALTPQSENNM